ncbi:hypothetical protein AB2L57_07930 [Microbacterium sp. HA-8]|uniref:hypothetical protein n=1 Tax=Microbacterium sp. HA-8 TaxID=3234200 RepID=UPI0038F63BAB
MTPGVTAWEDLTDSEKEVCLDLCRVMNFSKRDVFAQFDSLRSWSEASLPASRSQDGWAIIQARLRDEALLDPTLLAAAWLLRVRPNTVEQVERDTGKPVGFSLPTRYWDDPQRTVGAVRRIAAACLLRDTAESSNHADLDRPFRSSGNGPTPELKIVSKHLMRSADEWFELESRNTQARDLSAPTLGDSDRGGNSSEAVPTARPASEFAEASTGSAPATAVAPEETTTLGPQSPTAARGRAGFLAHARSTLARRKRVVVSLAAVAASVAVIALAVSLTSAMGDLRPASESSTISPELKSILDAGTPVGPPAQDVTAVQTAGWGPMSRDQIADAARTPDVSLNSIVDNPSFGDERLFARIAPVGADTAGVDRLALKPGERYQVSMFVHNSAREGTNAATGVRASVAVPAVMYGSGAISAIVSADNAAVPQVWAGVSLMLDSAESIAALRRVPGSVVFETIGGKVLPLGDELFTSGSLLGCDALNGVLPADDACAGYIRFEIQVDQPNFEIAAAAAVVDSNDRLSDHVVASVGDVLDVQVEYVNTGSTKQSNVVLRLGDLPDGISYVLGSATLLNSNTAGQPRPVTDAVVDGGINIGNYAPSANAFLSFRVQLEWDEELSTVAPGWMTINPLVTVETNNGSKAADLSITLLR